MRDAPLSMRLLGLSKPTMRIAIPNPRKAEAAARDWNSKNPVGCNVEVTLDDGSLKETKTASEAWVLGGHTAVIKLEGIAGGYALNRVRPQPLNDALCDGSEPPQTLKPKQT